MVPEHVYSPVNAVEATLDCQGPREQQLCVAHRVESAIWRVGRPVQGLAFVKLAETAKHPTQPNPR